MNNNLQDFITDVKSPDKFWPLGPPNHYEYISELTDEYISFFFIQNCNMQISKKLLIRCLHNAVDYLHQNPPFKLKFNDLYSGHFK